MNRHVVNGPPMRAMKGTDEEAKTSLQSLEKNISSLERFVWCEGICRKRHSHGDVIRQEQIKKCLFYLLVL